MTYANIFEPPEHLNCYIIYIESGMNEGNREKFLLNLGKKPRKCERTRRLKAYPLRKIFENVGIDNFIIRTGHHDLKTRVRRLQKL